MIQRTPSEIIRHLHSLTPNEDYSKLLSEEFGVDVPPSLSVYQCEHVYDVAMRSMTISGVIRTTDEAAGIAKQKIVELTNAFPWSSKTYEEVIDPGIGRKASKHRNDTFDFADGSIRYNEQTRRYEGFHGGRMVAERKSINQVKRLFRTDYNIFEPIIMENFN